MKSTVDIYGSKMEFSQEQDYSDTHPLMFVWGTTVEQKHPLILTIGREPNYGAKLDNSIKELNVGQFLSMSGGVWTTVYTQMAKQLCRTQGSASMLKMLCHKTNCSPILFSNAFPMGIPNDVQDKETIRKQWASEIPAHISYLFSLNLSERVRLVIHHGANNSEHSRLASRHIQEHCRRRGIPYVSSPFFHNRNSTKIQDALSPVNNIVRSVFSEFSIETGEHWEAYGPNKMNAADPFSATCFALHSERSADSKSTSEV